MSEEPNSRRYTYERVGTESPKQMQIEIQLMRISKAVLIIKIKVSQIRGTNKEPYYVEFNSKYFPNDSTALNTQEKQYYTFL